MEGDLSEPPVTYQEWHISKVKDQFQLKHLDSHIFEFRNANWFLRIYPRSREFNKNISLYLYREGFESEHVFFRIGMEGLKDATFKDFEKRHTFTVGSNNWGFEDFILYDDFENVCCPMKTNEGTLTISCIIRVVDEPSPTNYEYLAADSEGTVPPTEDHKVATFTMIVSGEKFQADPKVLAESSKFFASKVKDNRNRNTPIKIKGCDPGTFNEFLRFLENGDFSIVTPDTMIGLYKNSSVCEIPDLQAQCISCMKLQLSLDTFCDIDGLSFVKNETDLPDSITQFFIQNIKSILESTKWQEYFKSNHLRCNELFFEYLSFQSVN